jgi:hypothetical protein
VGGQGGKTASDFSRIKGLDSAATVIAGLWNHSFVTDQRATGKGAWPELTAGQMADIVASLRNMATGQ